VKTRATRSFFIDVVPYTLHFIQPAGTSRGVITEHAVWFVHVVSTTDHRIEGWGECAPLPGLSCDYSEDYENSLRRFCAEIEATGRVDANALRSYPSMLFGIETAFGGFEQGGWTPYDTPFSKGLKGIPINGLIWMGPIDAMASQIEKKLELGFQCIKLKIGSLAFEEELELLTGIRKRFSSERVVLRVDSNGAFTPENALKRMKRLAALDIHSIEQPIRAGQWEAMADLVAGTDLPIALDEELIGIHKLSDKILLLDTIKPHYLVLKPSLHGGISGCEEWIRLAEERSIGWWVTSALESNVGLNAIAQWCSTLSIKTHQGLGTGALYRDNIDFPLQVKGEYLWFDPTRLLPSDTEEMLSLLHSEKWIITLQGIDYDCRDLQKAYTENRLPNVTLTEDLINFLTDWINPSPEIVIQTSGSTGAPTRISVKKVHLLNSARLTCDYFHLQQGDDCLLCLPLDFIAAKMMVVRALLARLNLWLKEPDGFPFEGSTKSYTFVPLVPLQVFNTLNSPHGKEALSRCKNVLIGGGPISSALEAALIDSPAAIYASYGMAETLSHIALRRVNGPDASAYFTPFPGVCLTLSDERCLIIDAPPVSETTVYTGDCVELLPDGRFRVLGRKDNLILTGGKKVHAEYLESIIGGVIACDCAITSAPDPKFGERIVLVAEASVDLTLLRSVLPAWQVPKRVLIVPHLPRTTSGKIDRQLLKALVSNA